MKIILLLETNSKVRDKRVLYYHDPNDPDR